MKKSGKSPAPSKRRMTPTAAVRRVVQKPAGRREAPPPGSDDSQGEGQPRLAKWLSVLRATLDSTADGILVVDRDGKIVDFNQQFMQLWRIPRDVISTRDDQRALDFVLDELKDPEGFLSRIRMLYAHPDDDSFDLLEFKDGRVFERYSRPQLLAGRPIGRVWSFRDITRRMHAERALKKTADELQTILNVARDGVLVANVATRGFVLTNPAMCRITGYTAAELLGMTIRDLHPPVELPSILERFRTLASGETEVAEDIPIIRRDGSRIYCDVSAAPLKIDGEEAVMGIFRDITERKRMEDELRASEHWLQESQRASRVGSYVLDVGSGSWTSTKVLDEIFGIDAGYSRSVQAWAEIVHPDERQAMTDYFMIEVLQKMQTFNREYRIVRKNDGQTRWVLGRGKLFFGADDRAITMVGTIQDITERKQAEEMNMKLEAQILQTQKLESLGVLAGGIAHDFNNMLMVILGNAELAQRDLPAGSPLDSAIRGIADVATRGSELCNQLLAYAGKGRLVVKPMDLTALVSDMKQMLQVAVSKKAILRWELSDDLPAIEADATQLRQVIMNLVINASEAIGEQKGVVTITTGCMEIHPDKAMEQLWHGSVLEGPHVFLAVTDTGCGMDASTVEKIFDPFFTTKLEGRGLGLAAVLGIVRSHKAAIRIRSAPEQGSTFTILFPSTAQSVEPATSQLAPDDGIWQGKGLVLLVDDEESVRNICRIMLETLGFDVISAVDGQQAVALYREHQEWIRCVLLDMSMPNMDGAETLGELRKIDPCARVVLSSGYSEESVTPLVADGAGFIQKPYELPALKTAIRSVLG